MDLNAFHENAPGRVVRVLGKGYAAFLPAPLPPNPVWMPDLVRTLSDADRALGELAGLGRHLANPHLLIAPFIRREHSRRSEGALRRRLSVPTTPSDSWPSMRDSATALLTRSGSRITAAG